MDKIIKNQCADCHKKFKENNIYQYNVYGLRKIKICKKCLKEELSYIYDNIDNVNHLEYDAKINKLNVKFKSNFKYLDTEEHIIK